MALSALDARVDIPSIMEDASLSHHTWDTLFTCSDCVTGLHFGYSPMLILRVLIEVRGEIRCDLEHERRACHPGMLQFSSH